MRLLSGLFVTFVAVCFMASCGKKDTTDQTGQTTTDSTMQQSASTTPPAAEPTTTPAVTPASTPPKTATKPDVSKVTPAYVMLPESTAITIKLVDSIDTDIDTTGMKFKAQLTTPVIVNGKTLFAEGASAIGVLDTVIESGHLKTPAEIHYHLTSIQDSNGDWVDISTFVLSEKYGSHTNREVAMIGGGTVIGGAIGKLSGKKGGTVIGAAAGAAVGTAAAALSGKKDIVYPAGTEVVFILKQPQQVGVK